MISAQCAETNSMPNSLGELALRSDCLCMNLSFAIWPWEVICPLYDSVYHFIYKLRSILLIQMVVDRVTEGTLHENALVLSSHREY